MMTPVAIFSSDKQTDISANYRFEKYLSGLVATHQIGPVTPLIGSYKGVLERSWSMNLEDFLSRVWDTEFLKQQESFLEVFDHNKAPALLRYRNNISDIAGWFTPITRKQTVDYDGWTYNPYHDFYFTFTKDRR